MSTTGELDKEKMRLLGENRRLQAQLQRLAQLHDAQVRVAPLLKRARMVTPPHWHPLKEDENFLLVDILKGRDQIGDKRVSEAAVASELLNVVSR